MAGEQDIDPDEEYGISEDSHDDAEETLDDVILRQGRQISAVQSDIKEVKDSVNLIKDFLLRMNPQGLNQSHVRDYHWYVKHAKDYGIVEWKSSLDVCDSQEVDSWLELWESCWSHNSCEDKVKIDFFVTKLTGHASSWWKNYIKANPMSTSWTDLTKVFRASFVKKFEEVDLVNQLLEIRQGTLSLNAYARKFRDLCLSLTGTYNELLKVQCFIKGLSSVDVQQKVKKDFPATLTDAITKAQIFSPKPSVNSVNVGQKDGLRGGQRDDQPTNTSFSGKKRPLLRHSSKSGDGNEDCPLVKGSKNAKVNVVESIMDTAQASAVVALPHLVAKVQESKSRVRINSVEINGSMRNQLVKAKGDIQGHAVSILFDPGATHNFLSSKVVKKLGLPVEKSSVIYEVVMADGHSTRVYGEWALSVPLTVQRILDHPSFQVMDLGRTDVILGKEWFYDRKPRIDWQRNVLHIEVGGTIKEIVGTDNSDTPLINALELVTCSHEIARSFVVYPFLSNLIMTDLEYVRGHEAQVDSIQEEFHDVFPDELPDGLPPERGIQHEIDLVPRAAPFQRQPTRTSPTEDEEINRQLAKYLRKGWLRISKSPWAAPVVMVKKKDGTWRLCVNYKGLNDRIVKNMFPIPRIDDLLDHLRGARYFSKIDLRQGYHQICVKPEDVPKTAFRTRTGHYEFLVMPFGLTNAPATFQRLMNQVLQPYLGKFAIDYFDDILVFSSSMEEHEMHVQSVLQLLRDNKLYSKLSKCEFFLEEIGYLEHLISVHGVRADPAKIQAVVDWPIPSTVHDLRSFLGMAGVFRRFVKDFSGIAAPLTNLLQNTSKHATIHGWDEKCEVAFQRLKQCCISAPVLKIFDPEKPLVVETDASDIAIGAVLLQVGHPLAYMSHKFDATQRNWPTRDKELYAEMSVKIWYKHGGDNKVADALSRMVNSISFVKLSSDLLDELKEFADFDSFITDIRAKGRVVVPRVDKLIKRILVECHDVPSAGHPGVLRTYMLVKRHFFWPGMKSDVEKYVRGCLTCQAVKVDHQKLAGLYHPLRIPENKYRKILISQSLQTLTPYCHNGKRSACGNAQREAVTHTLNAHKHQLIAAIRAVAYGVEESKKENAHKQREAVEDTAQAKAETLPKEDTVKILVQSCFDKMWKEREHGIPR
ncbi:uncharacterized protein LOC112342112 [Selaginella moellendorffii]|uniref:uncharacterized protein LOC112342112 n=1 Tax=Selaginella moellendorffii TaxID=88036 RepID=UPI000D1C7E5C|nr:uncharacterized protein LOC112342112 [Selaginella moellendorffii]|eukprot:XP_024519172.1 uncharacterized protein LOC112342112 [Selaginella moellendorffii]